MCVLNCISFIISAHMFSINLTTVAYHEARSALNFDSMTYCSTRLEGVGVALQRELACRSVRLHCWHAHPVMMGGARASPSF